MGQTESTQTEKEEKKAEKGLFCLPYSLPVVLVVFIYVVVVFFFFYYYYSPPSSLSSSVLCLLLPSPPPREEARGFFLFLLERGNLLVVRKRKKMPRRDQEALLLQNSIAEEESSMGTQIPLAKSTSVTLFQHHHQGEGEKQQQFLGQNLEERDSLVLVVNDHQIAAEKDGDLEKPLRTCSTPDCTGIQKRSWYKSKILVGNDMCQSCYKKERLVLSNRICNDCQTTQTHSDWYRSKVVKGTYLCDKCYYVELLKAKSRMQRLWILENLHRVVEK